MESAPSAAADPMLTLRLARSSSTPTCPPPRWPAKPWRSPPRSASTPTVRSRSRPSPTRHRGIQLDPELRPAEIVSSLDRYIVGQADAKRAMAIALRNRYRRMQVPPERRQDIMPSNILLIGPTGVGKTEIARRLAQLTHSPFIKVEATKFTEVGYVGRDVESIIRDLLEQTITQVQSQRVSDVEGEAKQRADA